MAGYILKLRDDTSRVTFYVARYDVLTVDSVERMLRAVSGWGGRKMNVPTYRLLATV